MMRKIALYVMILCGVSGISHADSFTTVLGLDLPVVGSFNWGPKISTNFVTIDSNVFVLYANNYATGNNTYLSSATFLNNLFSIGGSTFSTSGGTTTANRLQLTNPLTVSYGGTGRSALLSQGVLYGNGTGNASVANAGSFPNYVLTTDSSGYPVMGLVSPGNSMVFTQVNGGGLTWGTQQMLNTNSSPNFSTMTLTGSNAGYSLQTSSSVKLGTGGCVLFGDGSQQCTAVAGAGSAVNGSGTANTITKWTTSNTIGNSLITDNGTNIQIHTAIDGANIGSAFFISTTSPLADQSTSNGGLCIAGAGPVGMCMGEQGGTPNFLGWIQNRLMTGSGSFYPLGLNPLGGNVGIGTTNPQAKLDLPNFGNGAIHVYISTGGHIEYTGTTPQISACGTGSPSVVGNDNVGVITTGGGGPIACTLTFASNWTNVPFCTVENESNPSISEAINSISQHAVTFGFSSALGSVNLAYFCSGWR